MKIFKKKNFFKRTFAKIVDFIKKKIIKNKIKFSMLETIVFMLIIFAFGLIIGGIIMYGKSSFYKSSNSLNEFVMTYNEIKSSYYEEVDDEKLLEAGISGMIKYLGDPYSTYMDKDTASNFNEDVDGKYQGIGAEIKFDDNNNIVFNRVFENSPAEKAGIAESDILLEIEGKSTKGMSLAEVSSKVKGDKNTEVKIKIKRNSLEKEITIKRDLIDSISVTSEIINRNNKKIGYIYISVFAANTKDQFKSELEKIEKEKIDSLIIDVRGNYGGYLTSVNAIASLFIKKGEPIYQLKTRENIQIINDETDDKRTYPIVVLADGGSASASELLVAALKESYGATIVGTKTFGKGKVQKVATLSSGAVYKYTHQEWLTPKGNYIDNIGITPDIEVVYINSDKKEDNQKEKAIEVVSK